MFARSGGGGAQRGGTCVGVWNEQDSCESLADMCTCVCANVEVPLQQYIHRPQHTHREGGRVGD